NLLLIAGGFGLLIVGANLLVKGAVAFARLMGVSEAVIGLTIIAAGTSLPELATSVVAAFKREADIAIGNIIGSNIFNILCILGVSASITPLEGAGIRLIDLLVMLGMAILLLPIMKTDFLLDRKEGLVLLAGYAGYVLSLLL
ncbi:sodium:calcium antiporter, partial [candidate division KSB3 bacterium]|nr:sodium:calcium antiporter [candidate division KSB3 bacterium]MBD3327025.1 sodium:calcium antiporter [candidate division KSB3 bacterium]